MSIHVELRDEAGHLLAPARHVVNVAAAFLDQRIGTHWREGRTLFVFLPYRNDNNNHLHGERPLRYETESIGFIQIEIYRAGKLTYRHPHFVVEVLEPGLRQWLDELGQEAKPATYCITGAEIAPLVRQSTPIPKWAAEVTPYAPGEQPGFRIRPIPPAPPALATLTQFAAIAAEPEWAAQPQHTDLIEVVVKHDLQINLLKQRPFSASVEDGGFLVGQIYENQERPGCFIAHVMDAVPAEQVGASFLHVTFTGDSFDRIKQRLNSSHQGQRLLGWYHTHLFAANETMGLSSIDLNLHFTTFRLPWQIAGLLNLDGRERVLRFYVRQGNTMALCHHQATPAGALPL